MSIICSSAEKRDTFNAKPQVTYW